MNFKLIKIFKINKKILKNKKMKKKQIIKIIMKKIIQNL